MNKLKTKQDYNYHKKHNSTSNNEWFQLNNTDQKIFPKFRSTLSIIFLIVSTILTITFIFYIFQLLYYPSITTLKNLIIFLLIGLSMYILYNIVKPMSMR